MNNAALVPTIVRRIPVYVGTRRELPTRNETLDESRAKTSPLAAAARVARTKPRPGQVAPGRHDSRSIEELRPAAVVCAAATHAERRRENGGRSAERDSAHRKRPCRSACRHRFAVAMEPNAGHVTQDCPPAPALTCIPHLRDSVVLTVDRATTAPRCGGGWPARAAPRPIWE